jgi:hypothetical protein
MSPAWRDPVDWDGHAPPQPTKTFIYKHREAMDPCLHPELLLLHGQFLSHHTGPVAHRKLVPQFSYCPTLLHHDIMAAMPINWIADILPRSDDPEWGDKTDERLQWRGSNTGIWHDAGTRWKDAQRARLVEWATMGYERNLTVLMPTQDGESVGSGVEMRKGRLSPAMLDVFFAGQPLSCAPETCDVLRDFFEYRKPQNIKAAGNYKYILDVRPFRFCLYILHTDNIHCRSTVTAGPVDSSGSLPQTHSSSSRQSTLNGGQISSSHRV